MEQTHSYLVNAHWSGARTGLVSPDETRLPVFFDAPPEFGGERGHWTPEHMLIAAVASCYVATFGAIAQMSKFDFRTLEVSVEGTLAMQPGGWCFTEITLRPVLLLSEAADKDRGLRLLQKAERGCLIARSLVAATKLEPAIHVAEPEPVFA